MGTVISLEKLLYPNLSDINVAWAVFVVVKSLLSSRVASKDLVVVDEFKLEDFKTKTLVTILKNLNVEGKTLVITDEENYNLFVAGSNLPNVYVQTKDHLSVYDLINADKYVITKAAIKKYEEDLK